jgi:small subunit ribosomal protein S9
MKVSCLPISLRKGLQSAYSTQPSTFNSSLRRTVIDLSRRQFTTSAPNKFEAAPPINFQRDRQSEEEEAPIFYARIVPESPSYFTAQPSFTDDLLALQKLLSRYSHLPTVKPTDAPRVAWRSLVEYRNIVGETVMASKYHKIVEILRRLNLIHQSLVPTEVSAALNEYKRDLNPFQNVAKVAPVDKFGRTLGVGRRKASTARAWVVEGTGEVLINGKSLADTFGRIHDRESAIWALKATQRIDKYNVWALVSGGGTTGQAEALTLAVGKALMGHEPALKPALRRGGSRIFPLHHYHFTILSKKSSANTSQLDVLLAILEEWKERSQVMRRQERCRHGSRDSLCCTILCKKSVQLEGARASIPHHVIAFGRFPLFQLGFRASCLQQSRVRKYNQVVQTTSIGYVLTCIIGVLDMNTHGDPQEERSSTVALCIRNLTHNSQVSWISHFILIFRDLEFQAKWNISSQLNYRSDLHVFEFEKPGRMRYSRRLDSFFEVPPFSCIARVGILPPY